MIARMEDDKLVDFKCGLTDIVCKATEQSGNWIADCINWLADFALGGQDFRPGDSNWLSAQDQAGTWLGMAIFVMFITFICGIAGGALMQRPDLIKRTLLATLASLPAFYFSQLIVGQGLKIIDQFSDGLLAKLSGTGGFAQLVETMFQGDADLDVVGSMGSPPIGRMMLLLVVMGISFFIIMLALAFRNFVLMILITFAPLAFVLLPAKGMGDEWIKRWMSAVTAMALAKPLIYGVLVLIMAGFGNVDTIWSGQGLTLVIGLGITAFMPMLAYGFFQFMGAGAGGDDIGQRSGGAAAQKTQRVVSAVGRRLPNGRGGGGGGRGAAAGAAAAGAGGGAASVASKSGGTQPQNTSGSSSKNTKTDTARPGQGPAAKGRFDGATGAQTPRSGDRSQQGAQPGRGDTRSAPQQPQRFGTPGGRPQGASTPPPQRQQPPASPNLTQQPAPQRPAPQVPREPKR